MADPVTPNDHVLRSPSQLFTVRVWLHVRQAGEPEWRGKVQHVASGEARYFRDWPTLLAYIQQVLTDWRSRENSQRTIT